MANKQKKPVYAGEFKAPHKVSIPELVAGLHEMDLAHNVIDQEGDTFEYHTTHLITTVVTQIFSYMINSGVQYGYICTGEAFVFLHIPEDPTVVQYYLCVPNQDIVTDRATSISRDNAEGREGLIGLQEKKERDLHKYMQVRSCDLATPSYTPKGVYNRVYRNI